MVHLRWITALLVCLVLFGCSRLAPISEPTPAPQPAQTVPLRVALWDDTDTRSAPGFELWVRGHGSWYPDLSSGGDAKVLGEFPVDALQDLFLYPDGRNGRELVVQFRMTADMIGGSDRDTLMVRVDDGSVEVVGTAIPETSVMFER